MKRMKLSFSEQKHLFVCGLYYTGKKCLIMKMHKIQSVKTEGKQFVLKILHNILVLTITNKSLFNNKVNSPLSDIIK